MLEACCPKGRGGSRGDDTCQSYPMRACPPPSMVARITAGQYLLKVRLGVSSQRERSGARSTRATLVPPEGVPHCDTLYS
jgi:hypothetical protein